MIAEVAIGLMVKVLEVIVGIEVAVGEVWNVFDVSRASPGPVGGKVEPDAWVALRPFKPGDIEQQ